MSWPELAASLALHHEEQAELDHDHGDGRRGGWGKPPPAGILDLLPEHPLDG